MQADAPTSGPRASATRRSSTCGMRASSSQACAECRRVNRVVVARLKTACHLARVSKRNFTIDDVAEAAGVARVTVSRVLNNEQNVRPETREKVRRAVQALGYSVNPQARALPSGSNRTILLIHSHDPDREPNSYYHSGLELGALRAF